MEGVRELVAQDAVGVTGLGGAVADRDGQAGRDGPVGKLGLVDYDIVDYDIVGRRFDGLGATIGDEFLINTKTTNNQRAQEIVEHLSAGESVATCTCPYSPGRTGF